MSLGGWREIEREMRFAPLRSLLERAADRPNADTARGIAVTGRAASTASARPCLR